MAHGVRRREEIPAEYTWDMASVFPSEEEWERAYHRIEATIPQLREFQGTLGNGPEALLSWLQAEEDVERTVTHLLLYASSTYDVETSNQAGKALDDRATALYSRVAAAVAFSEPEILEIGFDTLRVWVGENSQVAVYEHYFEDLESRQAHVRSREVEELLGMAQEPFASGSEIHRVLTDTDLQFRPARSSDGAEIAVAQGNISALLTDPDPETRRTAWTHYADAHLANQNTFASCLSTGVKQNVFTARARKYESALEAALSPDHVPVDVFHQLIETYRRNLPIWHKYWRIRRRTLGVEPMHEFDVTAPLTTSPPVVPYDQSISWIVDGMQPLGSEYVDVMRRGLTEQRWVDVYPNEGKRSGAYSSGAYGTYPFILMSYNDDIFSMSTLAHELGHSMHSYLTSATQPMIYSNYSLFAAEVASNFNQALVRAYLLDSNSDPEFQIAVIEEAMANYRRYFFIMPTLARFELEIHARVERGEALNASSLNSLMAGLFQEGYGSEVSVDEDRVGITWAQFPIHLYLNFYVYQYATGIAAAAALAQDVLAEGQGAAERYLNFLKSGSSLYPLDALKLAGIDMTSSEPVQRAFDAMGELIDRLGRLVEQQEAARA